MHRIRIRGGAVLAALLFVLMSAGGSLPALGSSDELDVCLEPGPCRVECREAIGVCHVVAEAARSACVAACSDDGGSCLRECAQAHRRARHVCAEERAECRLACRPEIDPACGRECVADAADCREERAACFADCRGRSRVAVAECRDRFGGDDGEPALLKRCLARVGEHARACVAGCRAELPCAGELRECLGECRSDPMDDGDTTDAL